MSRFVVKPARGFCPHQTGWREWQLNIMLKTNFALAETAVLPELMSRLKQLEYEASKGVFVP
jgi:hypothetical protein